MNYSKIAIFKMSTPIVFIVFCIVSWVNDVELRKFNEAFFCKFLGCATENSMTS